MRKARLDPKAILERVEVVLGAAVEQRARPSFPEAKDLLQDVRDCLWCVGDGDVCGKCAQGVEHGCECPADATPLVCEACGGTGKTVTR